MKVNRAETLAALLLSSVSLAAPVELPRPSPAASVSEKVGTARLTVTYSRPAVKGREIWGCGVAAAYYAKGKGKKG